MSLKKYLLAGGLSTVLILGACNGTTCYEEGNRWFCNEAMTLQRWCSRWWRKKTQKECWYRRWQQCRWWKCWWREQRWEITYSGEYGDFTVASFERDTLEPEEAEEEDDDEEEEGGKAEPTERGDWIWFTNNSDVPTTPEEAFGLDLAVRQMAETRKAHWKPDYGPAWGSRKADLAAQL